MPYDVWRDQGFITATPGNATDFAFIQREILELNRRFDIQEIGYDRTFAGEIVANLQDHGVQLVQFGQGFLSLAAPTAELQRLVTHVRSGMEAIQCCAGMPRMSRCDRILPAT